MTQDLAKRSLHALLWNLLGGVGKIFAQFVIQIWLARMLGPDIFGQYAVVLVIIGFGWLLADSGFGIALIQKDKINDDDVGYALGWVLTLSLVVGTSIVVFSPQLAMLVGDSRLVQPIAACGPIIAFQALSNLSSCLIRRNLDMKRYQIIQLSGYLGYGLVAISLAYYGAGVWSLVIGFLVQTIIVFIFGYAIVRHTLIPRLRGNVVFRNFGLNVLGTNLANWAIESADRLIIGRQWGVPSLGAYAAASNLSRAPIALLVTSVQSVMLSSASRAQNDPERLCRGYTSVISLTALITFPLFALLALKAKFVVHLLYGDGWNEAGQLFSTFCVVVPFYVLLAVTGPALAAIGSAASEFRIQLICAVALTAGLLLLADYPLSLAIWLIPCIYFFRFFLVYLALAKRIKLSPSRTLHAFFGGTALAILVVIIVFVSGKIIPMTAMGQHGLGLTQLLLAVVACLSVLHLFPGVLIGDDLSSLMLSRSAESKLAKILCRLIGLKK
ncbi:MAG: oligosaccharide flippase family protein [Hydrogenophaga sp.]|nr:oligosaccharide flippase family protein [Hydrogenophaga sp.]